MLCDTSDIVLLQETWLVDYDLPFLNSVSLDFYAKGLSSVDTSAGILSGRPYGGIAILWRKSIADKCNIIDYEDKRVLGIEVTHGDNKLLFLNIYMPYNCESNAEEFKFYLAQISSIFNEHNSPYLFVVGDFNANTNRSGSGIIEHKFGRELISFFTEENLVLSDVLHLSESDTFTFLSSANGVVSWLDHILTTISGNSLVTSVHIDYNYITSDHFPMIFELDVPLYKENSMNTATEIKTGPCRINWDMVSDAQVDTYRHTTSALISAIPLEHDLLLCSDLACSSPTHISAINRLHCNVISALTEADVSLMESKELNHHHQVTGWNELCREAHADAREHFICWVDAKKPKYGFVFEAMRRSRATFKSSLRQCYKDKERIKTDAIANHFLTKDTKAFWKEIKKLNNNKIPISDTICGITGENQIAQKWRDHFKSLLNSCSNSGLPNSDEHDDNISNFSDFKVIEVYDAICKLKLGKSAGLDGLRSEHFLNASSNLSCVVTLLFNACVNHQYLPVEIMNTVIVPIVKDTKADITIQDNYRPIAVTTVLSKVLEIVLLERYSEFLVTTSNQFGFKKKHSTEMAVYALKNVIDHYICNSSPVYVCYMDASKAFDKINHASLFKKMSNRKIPKAIVNLFVYWYQAQTFYVRWGNCLSESFHASNGVRQGGILSPYLFNLYIDDLSINLNEANIGCYINCQPVNHLVYADDMVILAPSPRALQQLLNICNDYAIKYDISYNVKKTKCMCVRPKLFKDITVPEILLGSTSIDFVTKYTYLGVEINSSFCDNDDIL